MKLKLSVIVCRKCWLDTHGGDASWWKDNETDEFLIGEWVLCPKIHNNKTTREANPKEAPPAWCPHKFEHAVAITMETADVV